jgi:vanillate O-demethylase ferredoxin subunit
MNPETGRVLTMTVAAVDEIALGIRRLTLTSAAPLPSFEAGAHVTLYLPSGLRREYSLCSDPGDRSAWQIAVKREDAGRGGSVEVHRDLLAGRQIQVGLPQNRFPLPEDDAPILLLAGGIGITPIVSMVHALRARGKGFRLLYCVPTAADIAFGDVLTPRSGEEISIHVRDQAGRRADVPAMLAALTDGTRVLCCGPGEMVAEAEAAVASLGWPPERFRRELFHAVDAGPAADTTFSVTLASSGERVEVPAGQTILEALLAAGHDVDYSCEEGTCGTCATRVIAGEPDHRDAVLTPAERRTLMTICCSRALGRELVLDL